MNETPSQLKTHLKVILVVAHEFQLRFLCLDWNTKSLKSSICNFDAGIFGNVICNKQLNESCDSYNYFLNNI